jgi:hypothetical protein
MCESGTHKNSDRTPQVKRKYLVPVPPGNIRQELGRFTRRFDFVPAIGYPMILSEPLQHPGVTAGRMHRFKKNGFCHHLLLSYRA